MRLARPISRLVNAIGSFFFLLMVLRTLDAESLINWATISVAIGISVVLASYPVRLGVFQYYPRLEGTLAPKEAAGRFFTYQTLLLLMCAAVNLFFWRSRFDSSMLLMLCLILVARASFELKIDLLRAREAANSFRIISLYFCRSMILFGGAILLHVWNFQNLLITALCILLLSFSLPILFFWTDFRVTARAFDVFNRKNIRRIFNYLRYTIFLTIPFFIDAVILFVERYVYANLADTARVAEYFVWSDVSRFYFNLIGILYLFEALPQALRRRSNLSVTTKSSSLQFMRKVFFLTSACGLLVLVSVKTFHPALLLGTKESIASTLEIACLVAGMWLWMYRMHILNIYFQRRRNTFGYFILSAFAGIVFFVLLLCFERFFYLSEGIYFLILLSNLLVIVFFFLGRRLYGLERVHV